MADTNHPPPLPSARLRGPLPPEVVPSLTWGPFSYRRYPVFSWPWLKRRTLLATVLVVLYGILAAIGNKTPAIPWTNILLMTLCFVAGFVVMVTGGPGLATWVRHRGFPAQAEVACIIVAAVLGFGIALAVDLAASFAIAHYLGLELGSTDIKAGANKHDDARMGLFVVGSLFFHTAVSGGVASMAYFSERRRLRARALHLAVLDTDMRLAVLQAQIEPHFLFNTLATIRPLIRQDAAKAESALDALADHLRATIPQMRSGGGRFMSTLGQQLDICASYLAVMQVRMGARLHHEMQVPQDLRTREFPPLMLLSLVENAIKHGVEPKPGSRTIVVRAASTGADLTVSVSDDGHGLKDGLSSGLGLSNIREQLHVRYGGKARLTVAARPEGGTVAEIVIPDHP